MLNLLKTKVDKGETTVKDAVGALVLTEVMNNLSKEN
jgi:hypothetical protein